MKKFLYLSGIMLLNLNIMAQIDLNDRNWDTIFIEDFSTIRTWSANKWQDGNSESTSLWRCFSDESWPDGVTTYHKRHRQAYQPNNAKFCADSTMKLIGEFKSQNPLQCGIGYVHAPWAGTGHYCAPIEKQHPSVHYHSGTIETIVPVGYGYYEIESKMPIHAGANTSFWFWSSIGGTYNEIDVFEHSTEHCQDIMDRKILSGIWYNPDGTNLDGYYDSINHVYIHGAHRYANKEYEIHNSTFDEYHTFGCLWLPEKVTIFCDGTVVTECNNSNCIPNHSMYLKITHKEDIDARLNDDNDTIWGNWNDTVTINYVKAYRLKADCNEDAVIRSISDFSNYSYSVKQSITMGSITGVLSLPNNIQFTMRAVDSIVMDKGFEVPVGTSMTLITQECPFCTDD